MASCQVKLLTLQLNTVRDDKQSSFFFSFFFFVCITFRALAFVKEKQNINIFTRFFIYFLFLSNEGPTLETLDIYILYITTDHTRCQLIQRQWINAIHRGWINAIHQGLDFRLMQSINQGWIRVSISIMFRIRVSIIVWI